MSQSAIPAAIAARDPEAMRAAFVGELVPVIAADVDPQTWDPRELGVAGGNTWQAVIWQERIWYRDEESLVDHDEITCIRLLDGVAYLTNDIQFEESVLSRNVDDPPEDPEIGQQWLTSGSPTGDWAGHPNEIAKWTARGYRYKEGSRGLLLYIEDEAGFVHFSVNDEWEDGTGSYSLPDGSIRPSHLLIRSWAFENQTTTAPPATGPAGEQYIIGASATGAWAGHDKKIAWRPAADAAFVITTPVIGAEVGYDKALGITVRWNGTSWVSASGSIIGRAYAEDRTWIVTASGGVPFDNTKPQIGEGTKIIEAKITPKSTTSRIRIRFSGFCSSSITAPIVALFVNSISDSLMTKTTNGGVIGSVDFEVEYAPGTTSELTFQVRAGCESGNLYFNGTSSSLLFGGSAAVTLILEEIAP